MESELNSLRSQLSDVTNEQIITDRHVAELSQLIQRQDAECDRKLSASKQALTTTDIQARECKSSFAQTERALLSSQKQQIITLAQMTKESFVKKAEDKKRQLVGEMEALNEEIATLSKERERVLEENIQMLKIVNNNNTDNNNDHHAIVAFMHKLLKMREGWREQDVKSISRFIREEVRSALTDMDRDRHGKFSQDKLQRTKLLQRHYSERTSEFNTFRIKRSTVNEEQRQQTVVSVRSRAEATAKKVATQMKEHVGSLEKLMDNEASNAHKEMRRTMETLTEQRRSYIASEEVENQHKLAVLSSQNKQERDQLVMRLKNEFEALRKAKAAIIIANSNNENSDGVTPTPILSEWFKNNKVKLEHETTRIKESTESNLGQLRGQINFHHNNNNIATTGDSKNNRTLSSSYSYFEKYDELRAQLDSSKSGCSDAWRRLNQRLTEFSHRVLENVDSLAGGVLRSDVVAQSAEAERVRQDWERELRRRMYDESLYVLGHGIPTDSGDLQHQHGNSTNNNNLSTLNVVSQVANTLRAKFQKSRDLLVNLRAMRAESLHSIVGETEHVSASFEEVLLSTTKLLDSCPELARVSTQAQMLQEIVDRDTDAVDEEREYVKKVERHKKRVQRMIHDAGPLLVNHNNNNAKRKQLPPSSSSFERNEIRRQGRQFESNNDTENKNVRFADDEDSEIEEEENTNNNRQSHRHQYNPTVSKTYFDSEGERSRKKSQQESRQTNDAVYAKIFGTSSKSDNNNNKANVIIPPISSPLPSRKAAQDPFVQQVQEKENKKQGATATKQSQQHDVDDRDVDDESFEPLVEFSDVSSQQSRSHRGDNHHTNTNDGVHYQQPRPQQQVAGAANNVNNNTPTFSAHNTTAPPLAVNQSHDTNYRAGSTASTTATSLTTTSSSNNRNSGINASAQQNQQQEKQHRQNSPQPNLRGAASVSSPFLQQAHSLQQRFGINAMMNNTNNTNNNNNRSDPFFEERQTASGSGYQSLTTPTPDNDDE